MDHLTKPSLLALALCISGSLFGCSSTPSKGELTIRSIDKAGQLIPSFQTGVYRRIDENTADLFLTDLPLARLADPADPLDDLAGGLMHIHIFLVPVAGQTPIDSTACNVTIRHTVLARGALGVYGGGGFMFVSGTLGNRDFGGTLRGASLRLVRSTSNFKDLLGPSTMDGSVATVLDEKAVVALADRVESLSRRATPIASPAQGKP